MSVADTVNTWFRERLACGVLARDTEAYNQVADALPDLIVRLGGEAPTKPTEEAPPAPAEDAKPARTKPSPTPPATDPQTGPEPPAN